LENVMPHNVMPRNVTPHRLMRLALVVAALLALGGCLPTRDAGAPIATQLIAAQQPGQRLVVVLPGRADDLDALRRSGMADAIQGVWPDADVLLAEVTLGDYMRGDAPERLHAQVIVPARERGRYREVWLAGASMGGMGTLMYDRLYPGEMDGLVLLAPYLGDAGLVKEIAGAGGVAQWEAGPPQTADTDGWQRELWRHIQRLSRDPEQAGRIWLAYGDRDRLRKAFPQLIPALPQDQVLVREGGHTWTVWSPLMGEVLRKVDAKRGGSAAR
jgi:pimeloyl-ACP methyl ester carboxylesterase